MSRLRIVAGEYGGRWISAPSGRRTRPTREMVREAWFSALGDRVRGARVLDLFAGSGALGLEALSRGGASVVFVESDRRVAEVLAENVAELGVEDRARIRRCDVASFLRRRDEGETWDLALADPPYGSDWPTRLAEAQRRRPFARLLCVEHRVGALDGAAGVVWQRAYGDTALTFLEPGPETAGREADGRATGGGAGVGPDPGTEADGDREREP